MLADEPTGELDARNERARARRARGGCASTSRQHRRRRHPLARVADAADRVIEMRDGRWSDERASTAVDRCSRLPRRHRRPTAAARREVTRARRRRLLEIRAGERVALLGPVGLRQDDAAARARRPGRPDRGRGRAGSGEPLSSLDAAARGRARARGIAYVFQGANLLPHFTAFENVAFAAQRRPASRGAAAPAPQELLDARRARREARRAAGRALRRRGAARRDRARARPAAGAAALRRADRPSRLRHRRARARPDRRAAGASSASRSSSRPTTPTSPPASTAPVELADGRVVGEERLA